MQARPIFRRWRQAIYAKDVLWFFGIAPLVLSIAFFSCGPHEGATPKPRAFPRVEFPEKKYISYVSPDCAFQFDFPVYASVERDSLFMNEKTEKDCWFDLVFPQFNARVHCSYYEINPENQLDSMVYDAFALVGKHTIKAQFIEEKVLDLQGRGGGILFRLSGPVASPTQFFLTDSTRHFLRGSLYFNNKVSLDSMGIIHEFIQDDIEQMLTSFQWK